MLQTLKRDMNACEASRKGVVTMLGKLSHAKRGFRRCYGGASHFYMIRFTLEQFTSYIVALARSLQGKHGCQ